MQICINDNTSCVGYKDGECVSIENCMYKEERNNMDEKEVMLVGFDIHKLVKGLCDQFLKDSPDMTDYEKKAYRLGIDNVLGLLDQLLSEGIQDEGHCYNNIAVHVPDLDVMTEFSTIEEIIKKM